MVDKTPNEIALMEVDWLLQESYKRAVKLRGITDWNALGNGTDRTDAEREVEKYQLEIAKLISTSLIEKKHEIATKEREKKWDEKDERFEKRMEESDRKFDKDEPIGFRRDKDDKIDDRGTDEIGKK